MSTDLHDLLVPYALDALDAHERGRFESHLEQCEVCRGELAGFQETSIRLADAVAETPPPVLRTDVLTRARQSPQERPVVSLAQRTRVRRTLPRLAVAASVLVATAGIGGYLVEHDRAGDLQAESQDIAAVMTADDASMLSAPVDSGGTIRVMHSAEQGDAVVAGSQLAPLDSDQVYQVWAMYDGEPRSVGLLDGRSPLFAADVADADTYAVTVEPDGGSEQPTSDPIAVATA